jgi:hypothetical protein
MSTNDKTTKEEVVFEPVRVNIDEEIVVTELAEAEEDIKKTLDDLAEVEGVETKYRNVPEETPDMALMRKIKTLALEDAQVSNKEKSDGSTASYYELPEGANEIQHLISFKNMNAQMGEIFRAVYRYGQVAHSEKLRDAKKIKYYIEAEIARLEKYGD